MYRTTYTPLSDLKFPGVVGLSNAAVQHNLFRDYENVLLEAPYHERKATELLSAHYCQVIMDDRALFEDKSFDFLRSHFNGWVKEEGEFPTHLPTHKMFLVVDEESLRSLSSAPSVHKVELNAFEIERRL